MNSELTEATSVTHIFPTRSPEGTTGRNRFGHRVSRATATLALLLVPFVVQAAPARAAGLVDLRMIITPSPNTQVGMQVWANVNLLGSYSTPTGSISFKLFSSTDTACSSPVFTSTVPVSGTSINSARFTTTHAGSYGWQATYSGNANYAPDGPSACGDPTAVAMVGRASTNLHTTASPSPATTGHATTTLSGGYNPGGTITFLLTGPDDTFCSGTPAYTSTVAANGNNTYDSGTFVPTLPGKYTWRTSYSGDDDNMSNGPTPCLDDLAAQTLSVAVTPPPPPPPAVDGGGTDKAHMTVFRPSTGVWYIRDSVDSATTEVTWGQAGDIPVAADYNGDGRIDIAVYRPGTGQWMVKGLFEVAFGSADDIPVPGDYNGDGRTDVAVWRPATGQWFVRGIATISWGTAGDVPVPGDYDGDGRSDFGVFRPSIRRWMVMGMIDTTWGWPGDIPVPGDYNGDGRTDIGVWRPSTGGWYVPGIMRAALLGTAGDQPQPGDYDGDGRTDTAVYSPTTGVWTLRQTTDGLLTVDLGVVGDVATSPVSVIWSRVTGLL